MHLINNKPIKIHNTMKNIKNYILPALASAMFFTACNEQAAAPSQADIDAQVEAKIKSTTEQWKADCDKRIMDAAQLKKDSILVKMGKQAAPAPAAPQKPKTNTPPKNNTGGVKTPPPPPPPPPPAPAPEKPKGLKSLSDQAKETETKGLKSLSDQSKNEQKGDNSKGGLKALQDKK